MKAAASGETSAREAWRAAQHEADAARERHAATEREINRHAARKSALSEAHTRLNADLTEAYGAHQGATAALAELPPSLNTETRLAAVRTDIDDHRRNAAQVRAEAQALAREAELADRRLQAILAERNEWQSRKASAASQLATIEARVAEVRTERAGLDNAPALFAEKRRALISEIERAESARRVAADALAAAETAMAETDRAAKASLEALSSAREACARAEERWTAPSAGLPISSGKSTTCSKSRRKPWPGLAEIEPGKELPPLAEIEENLEKLRRDRERLGAVNLRAEEELREVEAQHTTLTTERDDLVEAIKRLRQGIQSLNREARERLLTFVRTRQRPFRPAAVRGIVRRRRGSPSSDRKRRPARGGARDHRQTPWQEAADLVTALRRRAGADRAGADLCGVLDQSVADLRAGRGRRPRSTITMSSGSARYCTR